MGFSRQEYWSGLPFPSPGDLPDPGIEPRSPALQADALTSEPPGLFSCSVVSKSLWPHGLQHTRLSCPSPSHRACSNPSPLSWWCQSSHPLSSPSPPAFSLSQHQVFSKELALPIRWPKYWNFSFSITPSKEYSGLISFRINWFDLLAVQGTLRNLLQNHSLKASILCYSAIFMFQLSHPYMTLGKTTALTRRTFVGKVTSLLLTTLSKLVIVFLPKSKRLLISCHCWISTFAGILSAVLNRIIF